MAAVILTEPVTHDVTSSHSLAHGMKKARAKGWADTDALPDRYDYHLLSVGKDKEFFWNLQTFNIFFEFPPAIRENSIFPPAVRENYRQPLGKITVFPPAIREN